MMLLLISKHRKKIAFVLVIIFYLDFITPVIALAANPTPYYRFSWQGSGVKSPVNNTTFSQPSVQFEQPGKNVAVTTADKAPYIDGPGQPEMKSFQSVNSNNMVDLFTGDFSYSIPLLDVGGYPINIHYSSGITMDQEASWVGLGWNINPGSISRSMRGLPDDFDGLNDSIKKTQHIKINKTTGVTVEPGLEIVGIPINFSAKLGIFHNTYNGFGLETGVGIGGSAKTSFGSLTGNLSISNNSQEGIRINPSLSANFGKQDEDSHLQGSLGISTGYSSRGGIASLQINGGIKSDANAYNIAKHIPGLTNPSVTISFASPSYTPSVSMPLTNRAYSFTGKIGGELWIGVHGNLSITGYVNRQEIAPEDATHSLPAAGYLYSTNGNNRENVLLDYNRRNDGEFNYKSTPHIAIPQYTYDAFSISGEGISGSFRPYRGDVGYMFDHALVTRSYSENTSLDVGFGTGSHWGLEITNITSSNANHRWNQSNGIESKLRFQSPDTTYEPVYFRNPGEKTTNAQSYYQAIGDESLVRVKLSGSKDNIRAESAFVKYDKEGKQAGELPVTETLVKKQRDKRTQVISYFTAEEASRFGLDKTIKSYQPNSIPVGQCQDIIKEIPRVDIDNAVRKKNHLSEISVLNSDGRKYVYGHPIYNVEQKDVTFSIAPESDTNISNKGLARYSGSDNTVFNSKGKDNYFSKEEIPAYAHNFLLTGILSPDYVDLTGNGISEDDPGDAVKFNYTQLFGKDSGYYEWRTPFEPGKANYNEGFKTYNRDDRGTYIYGKKEIWYLNSVESKTMIAVFITGTGRHDSYAALGENGGLNPSRATRRLDRIDLYVKADLIKNGVNQARPVESVYFEYNEELCKGSQGDVNKGKLTLKKIWSEHNKNPKGQRNPYVFKYHPNQSDVPDAAHNPAYNGGRSDRWGTYKDPAENPGNMRNAEHPYTTQNAAIAARNASAWSLTDIQLPSGGKMRVTYESDDYAFVQDKRATQMFTIAGINHAGGKMLYDQSSKDDYYRVYINTTDVLNRKVDIKNRYLAVDDVLYFRFAVTMPGDEFGHGEEMVPGYATIQDYGITPGNNKQFWVDVAPVEGRSPFSRAALQFLRLNLRSQAYPGSEGLDDLDFKNVIKMLATSFTEIKNMVKGFDGAAKSRGYCNNVVLNRSVVRLSNPVYKKYGGGHRVKRIEIFDNWKHMTNQRESVYGQDFIYTTTEDVDGKKIPISSGVATYEPAIGAEENPFRRPISYVEKTAPMGPVNYLFSEEPIGESFFASPMIGYSKVRVRTIHTKARSTNGWEETEYYTSRDFPTIVSHTLLEENESKKKFETQSNILRLNHQNYVTLSQGFMIELNDMNGKMKAQSTYAEKDSIHPISYTLNFYRVDDDKVLKKHLNNKVWVVDSISGHIDTAGQIGKDIEIMADLREQRSRAVTRGFSPNVDIIAPFLFLIPVLVIPSKLPFPQKEDTRFRSAAIVKIIQRYGLLDSVVVMDKGSVVSTKNMLFDAETGNVLLSRTNNEFNDPMYNFNYPAYWAYSGMGMAYKNIGAVIQHKSVTGGFQLNGGRLYKEGSTEVYPASRMFESGDEVYVYDAVKAVPGADCRTLMGTDVPWTGKLWVMEAGKGQENDHGLYFIDSIGRVAPDMIIGKMVIIRSGKRNMPDVSAGSVVMLNNPLKQMPGGSYKVVIDSNTRVLNASASTFKDMWKVDNSEYQEDSCYTHFVTKNLTLKATVSLVKWLHRPTSPALDDSWIETGAAAKYAAASYDYIDNYGSHRSVDYHSKAILNFHFELIPSNAIINQATINLSPQRPIGLFPRQAINGHLNYNWNNTNMPFRLNEYASFLARITGTGSHYNSFTVSPTNRVSLANSSWAICNNASQNCTALIQDMIANPQNRGLMMYLADESRPANDRTRYLSFSNTGCESCGTGGGSEDFFVDANPCAPYLAIQYTVPKDTCVKVCRKNIVDSATNPYRWGILGSWRTDRSYAYYNARQESDATIKATNIRQEGTLKAFVPYWSFTTAGITGSADTTRWVWNSAISAFQRKGFEIENNDPLGRYNAGLYGYNQTLPVAVAQNSRYREILFDGFEDYGYKTTNCTTCPPKREFDFLQGNTGVDTTTAQSHTGLYSLRITNGHESLLTVPVDSFPDKLQSLHARVDSNAVTIKKVIGSGTGLTGRYTMGRRRTPNSNICVASGDMHTRVDPTINFNWSSAPPFAPGGPDGCAEAYSVTWTGTVQPRYTDRYFFHLRYNGTATIRVNGRQLHDNGIPQSGEVISGSIDLIAGRPYPITISYNKSRTINPGRLELSWQSRSSQEKEIIPASFLYPLSPADTTGSIQNIVQYYCVKTNTVSPVNAIRGTFSPLNKSKLTVSAWVRLDVVDCNATPVLDSVIQVQFNTGASTWLKKTGVRIEGWQRYEANVNVPSNAISMLMHVKTLSSHNIFVDDIRVQPFNSSLKGFVYNPVNLRLMAQLDENNYASLYEYDDEGTLIRTKKETERGIMTIQETRSALIKE